MFTSKIRITATALVICAILMGFSASGIVHAAEQTVATAEEAAKCYIFAEAKGDTPDTLIVFVRRLEKFSHNFSIIRTLGYYEGVLDTYGQINAEAFGSFDASRRDAAKNLYTLMGCTINVRI